MNVKLNIRLVFIYAFMVHTLFMLPIIIPFYQDHIGLTFQEFLLCEAFFAAVMIAMEVPSGWMSDVWSRKYTLAVGCAFAGLGYGLVYFADSFIDAMIAQGLVGIGVACNSGTVTTLIYDSLATKGKEHLYQKLEGKRHAIGFYAVAIASVTGGILYQIDPYLPIALDVITICIALICALMMVEPQRVKRIKPQSNPLMDMAVTLKYALHGHKEIAGIIIVSTVLFCSTKLFMWTQQPYMQHVGISTDYFGYIMAVGFLFSGVMGHISHTIKLPYNNRQILGGLAVIAIVCSVLAMTINHPFAIIFILLISGIYGFGFPYAQTAINKYADPTRRATILSTLGLLGSIAFIPASALLGWFDETFSISYGLGYLAIQLLIFASLGLWIWSRSTHALKTTGNA